MRLVKTCDSCPEQYDAFQEDRLVGYLRLRYGHFSANMFGPLGRTVYSADIGHDMTGMFESDEQRAFHLSAAIESIKRQLQEGAGK